MSAPKRISWQAKRRAEEEAAGEAKIAACKAAALNGGADEARALIASLHAMVMIDFGVDLRWKAGVTGILREMDARGATKTPGFRVLLLDLMNHCQYGHMSGVYGAACSNERARRWLADANITINDLLDRASA